MPKAGAYNYATDPSTRALTCVVKTDSGELHKFGPYLTDADRDKLRAIAAEHTLVAHNAPFDAAIWEHTEKLGPAEWFCTMNAARAGGFPGGLDQLSKALFGRGKDPMGKKLIDMLCDCTKKAPPVVGPAHQLLLQYNVQDVEELEFVYSHVKQYAIEHDVMNADRAINDRGVPIDRAELLNLIELYKENAKVQGEHFEQATGNINPRSPKQVKEWMQNKGFKVPEARGKESLSKGALQDFASNPHKYFVGDTDGEEPIRMMLDTLEARREVVRVGRGKADACLDALCADDRLRDQFVYYGGGPGRFAGRAFQMHNMPISPEGLMCRDERLPTLERVSELAAVATKHQRDKGNPNAKVNNSDVLNAMLRHLVRFPCIVADYNGVEARCAAWVSDCKKLLAMYANNESVYIHLGSIAFGRPISKKDIQEYTISKSLALGSIYGMSGAKFKGTCLERNMELSVFESMGLTTDDLVKTFRTTYPELPAQWAAYHEAVHNAVKGISTETGRCFFHMDGANMHCVLPSGRPIVYRNARIEPRVPAYVKLYNMPEETIPTFVYDHPRGYEGFLYGSKCLGADTRVVTRRGVLRITDVAPGDLVWDGDSWVTTDGTSYNGEKEVGEWLGVRMTHDHMIHDGKSWRPSTAMDDRATGCSLKWAASLAPWSLSNKCQADRGSECTARGASASQTGREYTLRRATMARRVSAAHMSSGRCEQKQSIQVDDTSAMTCCYACGAIVGQVSSQGALTSRAKRTRTTAGEAFSTSLLRLRSSWLMRSLFHTGTISRLTSIAKTTMATMKLATYAWLHAKRALITDVAMCSSCLKVECSQVSSSLRATQKRTALHGARSGQSSRMGTFQKLHESAPVYDLLNCGPKNRFTIVTSEGVAVVHNCMENICQAICRDAMAATLVNFEQIGLPVALHVHDEVGAIGGPERFREAMEVMSTAPAWAPGFPLLVEGYCGNIWTKQTEGLLKMDALLGKVLS